MVFDWFKRSAAPQNPEEASAAVAPEVGEPEPNLEPSPSAPAAPAQPSSSQAPETAAGAVDQDALDWARQAYARLKAQQEAEKQSAAGSPAVSAPAPSAQPASPPAPLVSAAESPATTIQDSEQSVQISGQSAEASQPPAPAATQEQAAQVFKAVIAPATPSQLPAAPPEPQPSAAPTAGLSLLEQAAAQRAQRQQELLDRAIDVPAAAPAPAAPAAATSAVPVSAPADEAAPQLGAFDEDFTWSAEVLAAQGRELSDISLEEIDWLGRLRRGMEKTRRGFVTQLLDSLGDDPLTPEVLDDLESLLLRADVGVQATDQVLEALRKRLNEEVVEPAEGIRFLKEQLKALLDAPIQASGAPLLAPERGRLNVWLMVGVNGVGKTTTLGKLANLAVRSGYSCLIAAADTFRAAAVQQVAVWGERSGVTVVSNPSANADPAAVVFDAIGAAQAKGTDLVLVDTAGRLQTKHNLMEELSKVRRIVDKLAPDAVVQSLLVLDASQGQNGLKQAMAFAQAARLTGVVITKLDGSSRGGVALAVASEAGLPIRFIGAGEGIRDLRPFNSFEFVEALLAK